MATDLEHSTTHAELALGSILRLVWSSAGFTALRALELCALRSLRLRLAGSWIDLGSGPAPSPEYGFFASAPDEVTLTDLRGAPPRVLQADLEQPLPFPDGSFDGALVSHALQYVFNQGRLFAELSRIVTREAVIVSPYALNYAPENGVDYLRFRDDYLARQLASNGFTRVDACAVSHGPLMLAATSVDPFGRRLGAAWKLVLSGAAAADSLALRLLGRRALARLKSRCTVAWIVHATKSPRSA